MSANPENFEQLLQKSIEVKSVKPGDIVTGTITGLDDKYVSIDLGLKSEGIVPLEEFTDPTGRLLAEMGDETEVVVDDLSNAFGETVISREKARRIKTWERLENAHKNNDIVTGLVVGKVKGGFTIDIDSVKAFLPGSLVDTHMMPDTLDIENKELDFKIIKMDYVHNNVVVSRRAVIEEVSSAERSKLLETLEEGQIVKGVVKNMTDYGVFVDLGGVDGLLHITDISWKRIKSPSEILKLGDEITVVILKFDREHNRISLGMKQLFEDPWTNIQTRYPRGQRTSGKVTNLTDYGCFVEIEKGIEGLVHMSEMDWTNKNIIPNKFVQIGDEVDVIVLDIDEDRRRISLGMKQCTPNPWLAFSEAHNEGDVIKGKIKSITDFGLFVGLEGNIDGLVHLSDISWTEPGEQAIRKYKKGEEIETIIINIDPERERISLGIKQLQNDPFGNYVTLHAKGDAVKAKVTSIEPKQALLELAEEVFGRLKLSEFSAEKLDDLTKHLQVGDEIEAKIISVNYKDRVINLSMKKTKGETQKDKSGQQEEIIKPEPVVNTTLGDLLKEQLESREEEEESEEE